MTTWYFVPTVAIRFLPRIPKRPLPYYHGACTGPDDPSSSSGEAVRGGVILPLEGSRWLITLAGTGEDHPPTGEEGFLRFARSLRASILHDAVKDAEPLSPVSGYRATENRTRRYEKLSRMLHNFVVLEDAACAFNPVYA